MHRPHARGSIRWLTHMALVVTLGVGTACSGGGSDGGPSGPTGPSQDVANVTVTLSAPSIATGETVTPTAVAKNAQGQTVQATFTWSSSNTDVATVTTSGAVKGVTAGTTNITVTAAGKSAQVALKVEPRNLDAMVEAVRAARGLPAMAGAIVSSKGLIAIGVAGTRRATGGPAVTREDRWHIGSNLKAITAALAAVAVGRGKIAWTTTVAEAFPELSAIMKDQYRTVTLEDLLANRGGVRNDPPPSAYAGASAREQRESLVRWALGSTPVGPMGSYHYSNVGFAMAGAMIERAMGGTYEELLAAELGAPLGVTSLGWGPAAAPGQSNQPVGHFRQGGQWVACSTVCDNPPGLSAAGRAHMSIGDWGRIISELLAADDGGSTLISQANARKLFTAHTAMPGTTDSYGLGWVVTTRPWAGGRTATHEGSNNLNHSVAWLGLETDVAFLAATNAADPVGGTTGAALDELVVRMLESQPPG